MYSLDINFLVPNDKIKFEKMAFERVDPFPHLPNLIDGNLFNKLTDEEQSAYCLVEGEYLFEFLNSSSLGEANDETPDWSKLND